MRKKKKFFQRKLSFFISFLHIFSYILLFKSTIFNSNLHNFHYEIFKLFLYLDDFVVNYRLNIVVNFPFLRRVIKTCNMLPI